MSAFLMAIAAAVIVGTALTIIAMLAYSLFPSVSRSRNEARTRADELVRSLLTPEEYVQLGTAGYLDVPSPRYPGRSYRIPLFSGAVAVLEGGRCISLLCAQPTEPVPDLEVAVIHKLMIEGNEEEYLKTANHLPC